jgi:ATP-dependent RNA circularization protein (DNA/RNA ligase family)
MGEEFVKFPTTPHLLWLGNTPAREDKLLTHADAEAFLHRPVTVEEKVDGANLGMSFDGNGNLLIQNRGNLVARGTKGQFAPLWAWLNERESMLFDSLEDRFILFGEWCYARHSIQYTQLPDWFLAFDIFDKRRKRFLSTSKRDEIVRKLHLAAVPKVVHGSFSLSEVPRLIGSSSLYNGPMEGIYFRQEGESWLGQRAKVVRAEFVQQIGEHWSKQPLVPNQRQVIHV